MNNTLKILLMIFVLVPTLTGSLIMTVITSLTAKGILSLNRSKENTGEKLPVLPVIAPALTSLVILIISIIMIVIVSKA